MKVDWKDACELFKKLFARWFQEQCPEMGPMGLDDFGDTPEIDQVRHVVHDEMEAGTTEEEIYDRIDQELSDQFGRGFDAAKALVMM